MKKCVFFNIKYSEEIYKQFKISLNTFLKYNQGYDVFVNCLDDEIYYKLSNTNINTLRIKSNIAITSKIGYCNLFKNQKKNYKDFEFRECLVKYDVAEFLCKRYDFVLYLDVDLEFAHSIYSDVVYFMRTPATVGMPVEWLINGIPTYNVGTIFFKKVSIIKLFNYIINKYDFLKYVKEYRNINFVLCDTEIINIAFHKGYLNIIEILKNRIWFKTHNCEKTRGYSVYHYNGK